MDEHKKDSAQDKEEHRPHIRILSMDGGGPTTLRSLRNLRRLSEQYPAVWTGADYIAGVSAGAINALILYCHDLTDPEDVQRGLKVARNFWVESTKNKGRMYRHRDPMTMAFAAMGLRSFGSTELMRDYLEREIFQGRTLRDMYLRQQSNFQRAFEEKKISKPTPPALVFTTFQINNSLSWLYNEIKPDAWEMAESAARAEAGEKWTAMSEAQRVCATLEILSVGAMFVEELSSWGPRIIVASEVTVVEGREHAANPLSPDKWKASDVAMTSSAIPIYTPIFAREAHWDPGGTGESASSEAYVDGAVFGGNPSLAAVGVAMHEGRYKRYGKEFPEIQQKLLARARGRLQDYYEEYHAFKFPTVDYPRLSDLRILSIGTETSINRADPLIRGNFVHWGPYQWLMEPRSPLRLLWMMIDASMEHHDTLFELMNPLAVISNPPTRPMTAFMSRYTSVPHDTDVFFRLEDFPFLTDAARNPEILARIRGLIDSKDKERRRLVDQQLPRALKQRARKMAFERLRFCANWLKAIAW